MTKAAQASVIKMNSIPAPVSVHDQPTGLATRSMRGSTGSMKDEEPHGERATARER